MNTGIFVGCLIGAVAGNFLYQGLCMAPDWGTATDRSFFMVLGILTIYVSHLVGARV